MKKLLLILVIVFSLISCSTDDTSRISSTPETTKVFKIATDSPYNYSITIEYGNENAVPYYTNTVYYTSPTSLEYTIPNEAEFFKIQVNFESASNYSEVDYQLEYDGEVIDYDVKNIINTFIYSRYL